MGRPASTPSRLAVRRVERGLGQEQLAALAGLSTTTYRRLEQDSYERKNPPIRYLVNLAVVLDCELGHICEPDWLQWTALDAHRPAPPSRDEVDLAASQVRRKPTAGR